MHPISLQGCGCDALSIAIAAMLALAGAMPTLSPDLGALVGTTINLRSFSVLFKILDSFCATAIARGEGSG